MHLHKMHIVLALELQHMRWTLTHTLVSHTQRQSHCKMAHRKSYDFRTLGPQCKDYHHTRILCWSRKKNMAFHVLVQGTM